MAERDGIGWDRTGTTRIGTVWIRPRGDGTKLDDRMERARKVRSWKAVGKKIQYLGWRFAHESCDGTEWKGTTLEGTTGWERDNRLVVD